MMIIFSIISILIGSFVLLKGYTNFCDAIFSKKWCITNGTIVKSNIKKIYNEDLESYIHDISYQYTVANKEYISDNVFWGVTENLTYSEVCSSVASLPKETIVKVFYDPSYHKNATLVPGVIKPPLLQMWFGAFPLIMGILIFVDCFILKENSQLIKWCEFYFFLLWFLPIIWLTQFDKKPLDSIQIVE